MRTFILALGIAPILSACASQAATSAAEPKPVLILSEWHYTVGVGQPWPVEIRMVAYDNGVIIRQPMKNDDPQAKPQFVWQQKTSAEVMELAARVKAAALEDIDVTDESVPMPLHMGDTSIQYWDAEKSALARVAAYGVPCAASDAEAQERWTALARSATHPRFLALCDALVRLPLDDAKEWHPAEMTVVLLPVKERPDKTLPWPSTWPQKWEVRDMGNYREIELCVPVGPHPDAVTAQILEPESEVWSRTVAVKQDGEEWWLIVPYAARIAMPSAAYPWISGPCSDAH